MGYRYRRKHFWNFAGTSLSLPNFFSPRQNINPIPHSFRKVNKSYRGRSCPVVVHCSDGVGRTGTYCLIDMVLNRMAKGAKEIDIAATLEHIRDQRLLMVIINPPFFLYNFFHLNVPF